MLPFKAEECQSSRVESSSGTYCQNDIFVHNSRNIQSLIIDHFFVVVLLELNPVVNALLQFSHPLHPNLRVKTHYIPFNLSLQPGQTFKSLKLKLLWDLILTVVVPEVEICKVKPLGWSNGHTDLISKECIVDEVDWVAVAHHHYDPSDDLPDLMVDEALPDDVET